MADETHRDVAERRDTPIRGASGANIILGIWLIIAPFVLTYELPRAVWNDVIVGFLVVIFAGSRLAALRHTWLSWVNVVLGLWLIAAPFVLGYFEPEAIWNDVILGIVVLILAAWSASATRATAAPGRHVPR
ncbi:MAG: SPW repeat protein [Phycisphaeraceae bacterium]